MARYALDSEVARHPDGTITGTLTVLNANPATMGPNRIPVARYTGPLLPTPHGRDPYYPASDDPACWTRLDPPPPY